MVTLALEAGVHLSGIMNTYLKENTTRHHLKSCPVQAMQALRGTESKTSYF
jgi:hypothetical protein